jgi:uncharacterized RDD family membrane protein YckC
MNTIDQYVESVLHIVHTRPEERQRIRADLRSHLNEALQAGEPLPAVLERMGAPEEVAAAFMAQVELKYAGFGRRLAAFAIDVLLVLLPIPVLFVIGILAQGLVPSHPSTTADYLIGALAILVMLACALAALGIVLLYFPITEGRFGQTLGKRLLGLWVLKENGLPIRYREAFLRRLSFYFDIFPFDALFIFFTQKRQRGFDIIARTIVVKQ